MSLPVRCWGYRGKLGRSMEFFMVRIMAAFNNDVSIPITFCSLNMNSAGSGDGRLKVSEKKIFNIKQIEADLIAVCDTRLGPNNVHQNTFSKIFRKYSRYFRLGKVTKRPGSKRAMKFGVSQILAKKQNAAKKKLAMLQLKKA